MRSFCVVILAAIFATTASSSCGKCEKPSALSFCSIPYEICHQNNLSILDRKAAETFHNLFTNGETLTSECQKRMKSLVCRLAFPACELGGEQRAVCPQLCQSQLQKCHLLLHGDLCPQPLASEQTKCIDLHYTGPSTSEWVLGLSISVVFSFLASVGINLQKKGLKQNELLSVRKPVYLIPLWLLGFLLIVLGSLLDFVAFAFAPQSLLAPLAALTLVWNMLLAPCFNKETLSRKDIAATLVIFTGATITVAFASHSAPSYDLNELIRLYQNPLVLIYFAIIALIMLIHVLAFQLVNWLHLTNRRHRLIQLGKPAIWSKVRLVGYAGLAGLLGGQSVLFAKSIAELVKSLLKNSTDMFKNVETYCLILALFTCLFAQVSFLNRALRLYDALSVVPIYQAYWIISGVMGGAIYFQEINSFSIEQGCMFVLGITTTIFGIAILAQRKEQDVAQSSGKLKSKHYSNRKLRMMKAQKSIQEDEGETDGTSITDEEVVLDDGSTDDDDIALRRVTIARSSTTPQQSVIDNFLDMSPRLGVSDLLDGLGYLKDSQLGIFSRGHTPAMTQLLNQTITHSSSSSSSSDEENADLEQPGMLRSSSHSPTNRSSTLGNAENISVEQVQVGEHKKKKKIRSITFSGFKNNKK